MTYDPERTVLPFDTPMADSACLRRSSRLRNADAVATAGTASENRIDPTSGTVSPAVPPTAGAAAPSSRRAARARSQMSADRVAEQTAAAMTIAATVTASELSRTDAVDVESTSTPAPSGGVRSEPAHAEPVRSQPTEPAAADAPRDDAAASDDSDDAQGAAEAGDASEAADDPFVAASRLFHRTGAAASVSADPAAEDAADSEPAASLPAEATDVADLAARRGRTRRLVTAGASVGVMGIAGLLAVSMTLPAEAVAAAQGVLPASAATSLVATDAGASEKVSGDEIQAFVASSDVQNDAIQRTEDYSTMSLIDLAAEQGIKYSDSLYTNDQNAAIQWPFPVGVAMTSGYGPRWGTMHQGIDLVPGEGAPIQSIAAGTVRIATESGGGYGVTVYIDHVIDGQVVTSHYAHMQYGSLRVKAGDTVEVGDIVGLTGNTGHSYGAHLHFEIIINGSPIDPLPWMQKNAGRYDGVTPPVS